MTNANQNSKSNLQWVGVLAGAYKGSTKTLLNHVAVGQLGLAVGRIKRAPFAALCRSVDDDSLCDEGSKGTKRCEACEAIVARHGLDVAEEVGPASSEVLS